MMFATHTHRRPVCPANPTHGAVLDWPTDRWGFHCPHQDHDGRPKAHPYGPSAPTRAFFTTTEVEQGFLGGAMPFTLPPGTPKAASAAVFGRELVKALAVREIPRNELWRATGIGRTAPDNHRGGAALPQ